MQPDDGIDLRFDRCDNSSGNAQADRKAAQLCAQIHRTLDFVVPEMLTVSALDAIVLDVQPAPNTAHLLILLQATASHHLERHLKKDASRRVRDQRDRIGDWYC